MSVTENIDRIEQGKTSIISTIKSKGVNVPNNILINEIAPYINEIQSGSGGDTPDTPITELEQKYEGATVFRINVPTDNYEFAINLCNNASTATYDVDWGDGSLESGLTTDEQHHTYAKAGIYDVNVYNLSKDITIVGGSENKGLKTKYINNVFNNTNNDTYIVFLGIEAQNDYICTDILFGDKITSIGSYAFNGYKNLKSVTISENLTSIGSSAFVNSGLKYLIFNAINCNDFSDSSYFGVNLVVVKIGNKVKKIPSYFLKNNSSLNSITIPDSVTSIGNYAFGDCSSLTSITIPNSVTSIGSGAFRNCTSLTSITIPDSVTSIGNSYAYTFENCTSLTSITIPDSVTELGYYTFSSCKNLKTVILSKSIKKIPQDTFSKCTSLTSITIPDSVTSIDYNAFYGCSSLTSITIGNGVTSIGSSAFYGCSSLTSITIGNGVTSIGNYAFGDCSSLTSITIPNSVTSIGSGAFNGCTLLYDIKLGDVKTISSESFYNVYLYTKLTIPSSVTTIGNNAFYSVTYKLNLNTLICEPLTAPTIQNSFGSNYESPERYIYIHKNADIESYTSGNWKTYMLDKGWELRYIEDYEKEPTILKIKTTNNFFNDLSNIIQANLINYELVNNEYIYHFDDKISFLHKYLFNNNTLENIEIPSTVTYIGSGAFSDSVYLQSITVNALTAPTIQFNAFQSVGIKVPSGTPKILRVPKGATGYDTGNWKTYLIDKGYTLEYIEPEEPEEPIEPELPEVAENEDILVIENVDEVEGSVLMRNPNNIAIQYSTNGSQFNDYTTATEVSIKPSEKVYFKWSDIISNSNNSTALVSSTIKYNIYGELKKGNNKYAYNYMFFGERNLTDASGLNLTSTSTAESCYQRMFTSCISLITAPEIFATTLKYNSFYYMFYNCTSLNYVKHNIIEWNTFNATDWLYNVAPNGTMYCPLNSTIPSNDDNGIPSGWKRVNI